MTKFSKLCLVLVICFLGIGLFVFAQEPPLPEVNEAVNLDENIQPADLGVGEPRVLPTNPLYFFKDIARGIRAVFAFNPVTKAELRLEISNEKLIEAKKLAEIKPEAAAEALESYKIETDQLKAAVEKIPIGAVKEARVDNFLDKVKIEIEKRK